MSELPQSTRLMEPIELSDEIRKESPGNLTVIVDRSNTNRFLSGVNGFQSKDQVKEKVRQFVANDPGRAALTAMATGAALTGLLRYLVIRKKSRPYDHPTR